MTLPDKIVSEIMSYQGETGKIDAYVARPDSSESCPAVVVIHEIYGLVEHTKDVANRFARQGYVALAPHLFSGDPELRSTLTIQNIGMALQFIMSLPPEKVRDQAYIQQELSKQNGDNKEVLQRTSRLLFGGMPKDSLTQDLVKAVEYLSSQNYVRAGKIGSVGFCFGGGMSINLACHAPTAACIIFYGENPSPIDLIQNVKGPVLGIYGGEDQRINSNLDQLVKAMAQYKKDFEMRIYPGASHAFFNDTEKRRYNEAASIDAWDRVLRFYERTLKAS